MNKIVEDSNNIRSSLLRLLELKSEKDGKTFSPTNLAAALAMPHSMIVKILHPDPSKRVHNPRVETIEKIVSYFQEDGFQISIDDVLRGKLCSDPNTIQNIEAPNFIKVPIINWDELKDLNKLDYNKRISKGSWVLATPNIGKRSYAIEVVCGDMSPRYEIGEILIIDPDYPLKHKNKVIFLLNPNDPPVCKQIFFEGGKKYLKSHNTNFPVIPLIDDYVYLGSIRQVRMEV